MPFDLKVGSSFHDQLLCLRMFEAHPQGSITVAGPFQTMNTRCNAIVYIFASVNPLHNHYNTGHNLFRKIVRGFK